jgi:hypothetical protein
MVVFKLKCLTEGCDATYIGESKLICNVRMEDHESYHKSHVYEHHKHPGHRIDFANFEILDRANTLKKLEEILQTQTIFKQTILIRTFYLNN